MSSASSRPEPARRAAAWRLLTDPAAAPALSSADLADFAERLAALLGPVQAAALLRPALAGRPAPLSAQRVSQARLLARQACHHQTSALRRLQEAAIPVLVLKGFALAHRAGGDPLERIGNDVDVLVPEAELQRAVLQLTGRGWRFAGPPPPRWGRTARVSLPPLASPDHATSIDLHREADEWPFARALPSAACFARSLAFRAGELELRTLPATEALLLAVSHATWPRTSSAPWRCASCSTSLWLLRTGEVEAARLRSLAGRAGLTRPLATVGFLLGGLGYRGAQLPSRPPGRAGPSPCSADLGGPVRAAAALPGLACGGRRAGPAHWRVAAQRNARRLGGLLRPAL